MSTNKTNLKLTLFIWTFKKFLYKLLTCQQQVLTHRQTHTHMCAQMQMQVYTHL